MVMMVTTTVTKTIMVVVPTLTVVAIVAMIMIVMVVVVVVGNGNKIECWELCEGITIHVQNQIFTIDFHVLPLCGTNVVLGV